MISCCLSCVGTRLAAAPVLSSAAEQAAAVQQDLENGAACTDAQQSPAGQRCVFEDALLTAEVLRVLGERPAQQPLFLFWA